MGKFNTRSLPNTANLSKAGDQFIKAAQVSTRGDDTYPYPWLDPNIPEKDMIVCYFKVPRQLGMKVDYIAAETRLKKRVLFEEALEKFINDWLTDRNIPV